MRALQAQLRPKGVHLPADLRERVLRRIELLLRLEHLEIVGQSLTITVRRVLDRLRERHSVRWLVEVTCLIGHYGIISGIANAFELAPAAGAEPLPLG